MWITEWAFAVVFIVIIIKWKDLENPHTWKCFQILFFIMLGSKLFQSFAYSLILTLILTLILPY